MKSIYLTATAALALAACSGNSANDNVVANTAPTENALPETENTAVAPEAAPPAANTVAVPPPEVRAAPKAEAPPAPRRPATPRPKQEPADPHAGHDMSNMANMSH